MSLGVIKINRDLRSTFINSLWKIISGPLLLVSIPYFMTPLEQGYWYNFTSLAAFSVFADLGFTTIVLQFAAHEFSYLRLQDNREISGDQVHLWHLASFFRFVIHWGLKVTGIVFPIILIGGYFFMASKGDPVHWQIPWLIFGISSAVVFINESIFSFFEGCNSVALLQSIRFRISFFSTLLTIFCLIFYLDLYALAFSWLVRALVGAGYILYYFRVPILQLWYRSARKCYNWWPEFSSLIWRYAISWSSGYFIFQLFTPLAFYFHGAEFAGKIGISIAMWTAGYTIANSWMTAIVPRLNMLVSKWRWKDLDRLFQKNIRRVIFTMIAGGSVYFLIYATLADQILFFRRVLDITNMLVLYISWTFQSWVNAIAVYLRAHKKEPLMQISAYSAAWVAITTYLCARYLPEEYMFLGFLSQYIMIPWIYRIYKKQRQNHSVLLLTSKIEG